MSWSSGAGRHRKADGDRAGAAGGHRTGVGFLVACVALVVVAAVVVCLLQRGGVCLLFFFGLLLFLVRRRRS